VCFKEEIFDPFFSMTCSRIFEFMKKQWI